MTCFWDGILRALDNNIIIKVLDWNEKRRKPRPTEFIPLLKEKAIKTPDIYWNGNSLSEKELDENLKRIHELDVRTIHRGYDCSACEPYLLLISKLFMVNIKHNYNGHLITYTNIRIMPNSKPLIFHSNRGHFW